MTTTMTADDVGRETAAQLSQRVSKLQEERDRLEEQASATRAALGELRARLVTGDVTLGDVAVAQAKASALDGAIGDADAELTRLRLALAEAEQREAAEAKAARRAKVLRKREQLQEEFSETARELDGACEKAAVTLHAISRQYGEASMELREIAAQEGNQRLADIYARQRSCVWPDLKFPEPIAGLLMVFSQQETRREEKRRRAALRARSA